MDWKKEHPRYDESRLLESDLDESPWTIWELWQKEASRTMRYTNEIAIATADTHGKPSVRMVLLKHASADQGFCWFSNRASQKGREISHNPQAQILWYSNALQRQVRISGTITELAREEVQDYARSRPRNSQISAYISRQSREVSSRMQLEKECRITEQELEGSDVPLSSEWTGYRLDPSYFEFWQGSSDRLHDRIVYALRSQEDKHVWAQTRLYP